MAREIVFAVVVLSLLSAAFGLNPLNAPYSMFGGENSIFEFIYDQNFYGPYGYYSEFGAENYPYNVQYNYHGEYYPYGPYGISNAALGYRFGAFSGAFLVYVNGYYESSLAPPYPLSNLVETAIYNQEFILDYQVYASPTLPVVRVLLTFEAGYNPVDLDIIIKSTSGAGSLTKVFGDYTGEGVFNVDDFWVVFGDGVVNGKGQYDGTPYVTYSVSGPGASIRPVAVSQVGPVIEFNYNFTLIPGKPVSLLFFAQLSDDPATAIANTAYFTNINALQKTDLLFGLSSDDLNSIVNWNLATGRKVSSYTGICDFASEVKDRVSKLRTNQRHAFSQPWRC